jgi:hypothetical protein
MGKFKIRTLARTYGNGIDHYKHLPNESEEYTTGYLLDMRDLRSLSIQRICRFVMNQTIFRKSGRTEQPPQFEAYVPTKQGKSSGTANLRDEWNRNHYFDSAGFASKVNQRQFRLENCCGIQGIGPIVMK